MTMRSKSTPFGVAARAAMQTVRPGQRDVAFTGKWIHDLETANRMEGDVVMISTAFRF